VTAPIGRPAPILVEDWKKAQRHTERPVRAIVTGPYTLMHWSYDEHYGSRKACAQAFCAAIAEEVTELAAAGATEIQLDEPALGVFPEETAWATELIGEIGARRGTARLWAYVAFGDLNPDWKALAGLPVDCLMIGLAHQGLVAARGPASLPSKSTLVAGVVDAIQPDLESAHVVRERVEQVMKHVPAERLVLATDAGLRGFAPDIAEAKVGLLVETASGF
jgi:5-methyltetrahydropteroyltriglutamate--homocysteine methyltransferase